MCPTYVQLDTWLIGCGILPSIREDGNINAIEKQRKGRDL